MRDAVAEELSGGDCGLGGGKCAWALKIAVMNLPDLPLTIQT